MKKNTGQHRSFSAKKRKQKGTTNDHLTNSDTVLSGCQKNMSVKDNTEPMSLQKETKQARWEKKAPITIKIVMIFITAAVTTVAGIMIPKILSNDQNPYSITIISDKPVYIQTPISGKDIVHSSEEAGLSIENIADQSQDGIIYEFAFVVYSISRDEYLRHVGPDASKEKLGEDECYALYMTIHNISGESLKFSKLVMTIDDDPYVWPGTKEIKDGRAMSVFLGYDVTKNLSVGNHTCTVALDDKTQYKTVFRMPAH